MDYILASSKSWNLEVFLELRVSEGGSWSYVETPEQLKKALSLGTPKYIFFLHWNWLVPESIFKRVECVCFHMTDVPFGRGGSPLQNLIIRGYSETKLTALRMEKKMDAGPVYGKRELSLSGTAEEIYKRAARVSVELIQWIVKTSPEPVQQKGEVVVFERRKPEQSKVNLNHSIEFLYDFIRMLDAPGYPKAFVEHDGVRLEFTNARWRGDELVADVAFKK